VFVAGDLFWYPVEGDPTIRVAPDVLVVFGRPKDDRGSYMQWLEDDVAPHVVFEIVSPSNRAGEIVRLELEGWLRAGDELREIPNMNGWVSPRLRIRFELAEGTLIIYGPDGRPFATYVELVEQRDPEPQRADRLAAQIRAMGIEPEA
jgi:hypothetical protein